MQMFLNNMRLAWRNLQKSRAFSLINIAGLSIGMAACIAILLFVQYERSFDAMHHKNIYRLNEVQSPEGMTAPQKVALSMSPMGPTLKNEFPAVKNYLRIFSSEMAGMAYKDKKIYFENIFWSDSTFFDMLDYQLLQGDPRKALAEPNSVVLTEESATRLFGSNNAMGQLVEAYHDHDTLQMKVTGIMQNVPQNSHLQFNGLYSLNTMARLESSKEWFNSWGGNWLVTYLELAPGADVQQLEAKFPAYLNEHLDHETAKCYQLFLQPLQAVHGTSGNITHDYHNFRKFDNSYTNIFLVIAIIVLVIGCINFINLSTAKSAHRAKEVGVRKTIGARRLQLFWQFMSESLLLSFIAMLLAIVIVKACLPFIRTLSQHELQFSPIHNPALFVAILLGTVLVGLLSGIYPALYLSSFIPVKVLKGRAATKRKSLGRNVLVVGQFACAAFLISATIFAVRQLNYMRQRDAGFNKEQVLVVPGVYNHYQQLKTELAASPYIKSICGSSQSLGNNLHQRGISYRGAGPERGLVSSYVRVDEDFISLYHIKLLAGHNFSKAGSGHETMVNAALAKELLKDKPGAAYSTLIGHTLMAGDSTVIVGVTSDFNFNSLHNKVETLCMGNNSQRGFHDMSVKIDGGHAKEAIAFIEAAYKKNITSYPFSFQFLDERFEQLYRNDGKVSAVVSVLGGLAIFIACLGLLGLASYLAETRTREIGVRKVLGASVSSVVSLLSKDFIRLVLLANLIAWPLAWYVIVLWLQNYAYHVEVSPWVFACSMLVSIVIALASVSSQTWRSATANPIKSLRTE